MGKNWFMFVAMSLGTEFAVMSATPVPDGREAGHPCVVTTPSEKSATLKLIEEQDWARKVVEALRQNVDKYAERGGRLFEFAALYELENTGQGRVYPW